MQEKAAVGTRLALISLFEGKIPEAMDFGADRSLKHSSDYASTTSHHPRQDSLKPRPRYGSNQTFADDYSKNTLLLKSEIYWNAGMWNEGPQTHSNTWSKLPSREKSFPQSKWDIFWIGQRY